MTMRSIFVASAVFAAMLLPAAVKPGENLVLNGVLEADQLDFPPFWYASSTAKSRVKWNPSGGPDGLPYFSLKEGSEPDIRLRQFGLDLVSNGLYRISMQVRTRNFRSSSHTGVMLVNGGSWRSTAGVMSLPKDTGGKWRTVSKEFKCFGTTDGYMILLRTHNQKGELDMADIRLEALDSLALDGSGRSKLVTCETEPRVVPLTSLLSKIPADDRFMQFRFFGELEGKDSEYEAFAVFEGSDSGITVPVSREKMRIPVPAGIDGGQVTVGVKHKTTGKTIVSRRYNFRVVPSVSEVVARHARRRLNNLSAELVAVPVAGNAADRHAFAMRRDGWVFVAVSGGKSDGFTVKIDGSTVIDRSSPRHETFRQLQAGEHVIEVVGVKDGRLIVREIAEIFNYCPGVNSYVRENPPYDWAFNERYVLPAVTTQLGGRLPKERRDEFYRRGYIWMHNINLTGSDPKVMIKKLSECRGLRESCYRGVACDEQNYADVISIDKYAAGFWAYDAAEKPSRAVYTWAYGKPSLGAVSHDFLSACINIGGGRGKLVREHYCSTRETEEEARQTLRHYVGSTFATYRKIAPEAMGSLGLVYGNFNQVPILSKAHHPEVDYKYYLDMQMNFAANDPLFADIGLIGYWGSYYADEELHRWSFALTRHYVVEGNTNMLSEAYGFRYRPDHLFNGDFRGTLEPWRTEGKVRADSHMGFASKSQNRWGGSNGVGDTFAVLVREEGAAASISQKIKGLSPGKKYCLQFAAFDVKDVKAHRVAPRHFGVSAKLSSGAEIDEKRSWLHVDKRIKGRYAINNGVARINLHHIVFTARAGEVDLVIDNSAAKPGEELGVNYVSLNPYYE